MDTAILHYRRLWMNIKNEHVSTKSFITSTVAILAQGTLIGPLRLRRPFFALLLFCQKAVKKASSTQRDSQAVPHPSTNRAL